MNEIIIRVNGRGNAWPIYLGQQHPFYDINNALDLSNASYSIICRDKDTSKIKNEVLIDAGHGVVQFLVQNQNHVPNALVLTHPHIDHCLSTDWIAQSFFKIKNQKLPLYASKICWEQVLKSFPQLVKTIDFKELKPGISRELNEFENLEVIFYPVFHADSAPGSGMILFKEKKAKSKALFTGDVVCPLLRNIDFLELNNCNVVYADTNNRFAYPESNHWSFSIAPEGTGNNPFFDAWYNEKGKNLSWLIHPNLPQIFDPQILAYFNEFVKEQMTNPLLCFTITDFVKKILPVKVNLLHYSGSEDKRHNNQDIFNEKQLEDWAKQMAKKTGTSASFHVPKVGDECKWIEND
jgi:glyoxylase-like metal-dependent hydrolase (beta-lactamase superfamily II)